MMAGGGRGKGHRNLQGGSLRCLRCRTFVRNSFSLRSLKLMSQFPPPPLPSSPPPPLPPQQRSVTFSHLPSDRDRVARLRIRDYVHPDITHPYTYLCCLMITILVFFHFLLRIMGFLTSPMDEDMYEIE